MKDETTNSYELTLTPNYVSDWRPISRQELRQKKMQAACTECGLKIESRRNQP